MNLYIPELGEEIVLTEDWSFPLYSEYRNETLAETLGYYLYGKWIKESVLPRLKQRVYQIYYPPYPKVSIFSPHNVYKEHYEACRKAEEDCVEYQAYLKDLAEYQKKVDEIGEEAINVTLEKGTILKIDRIYIRKGNKDFSSITFYVTSKPKVKRTGKALRFWAKLSDCNKIICEKVL